MLIAGWAVAQYPYLLPETLTVEEGAGAEPTLTALIVVFVFAVAIVGPCAGAALPARPEAGARVGRGSVAARRGARARAAGAASRSTQARRDPVQAEQPDAPGT